MRRIPNPRPIALSVALLTLTLGACVEERVVAVRGSLANVPGSVGGIRPDGEPARTEASWDALLSPFQPETPDGEPLENNPLRIVSEEDPEDVRLVINSPRHLMIHLFQTITGEEWELLYEQVLSDRLKSNYRERLKDPREAVTYIRRRRTEVLELLNTMPAADQTPGVFLEPIGRNTYRLVSPGAVVSQLRFTKMDLALESGQFRLLMIH